MAQDIHVGKRSIHILFKNVSSFIVNEDKYLLLELSESARWILGLLQNITHCNLLEMP